MNYSELPNSCPRLRLTLGPIRTTGIRRDFHKLDHF